jgi:UDPglucose 6-dehydrogenase
MSLSVLLVQHNDVTVLDVDVRRVKSINDKQSTVSDMEIKLFLAEKSLSLTVTLEKQVANQDVDFIIVCNTH